MMTDPLSPGENPLPPPSAPGDASQGDVDTATGTSAPAAILAGRKSVKTVSGVVVSTKMQKTVSVEVMRLEKHTRYKKFVRRKTRYKAHDEKEEAKRGDLVRIAQTRPLSKTKRWRLVEVISRKK